MIHREMQMPWKARTAVVVYACNREDILQNPISGRQQSRDQFWNRITDAYKETKNPDWEIRSARSVQNRIQAMKKAVRKLLACIKKVKILKPSGASEMDIVSYFLNLLLIYIA
ncbi:uncharacterized protein LOC127251117 isoform X2 [Andrographis paniculata]|uniref:uncharacterized protein LOC127251117 isoform X2 n=1 Tax=Andrographis paniculata TaxID=175694 RepID=UPI0021E924C1|nr:uncharacterized protein LOC127251117 isoform X2 [Andrographis paniculata]